MNHFNRVQLDYLVDSICAIQQIPSPTFSETVRGEYILDQFKLLGLSDVYRDAVGNIYGCWPGKSRKGYVFSAHLDTVHAQVDTLPIIREANRITGPGVGDNSTGVAALLAVGAYLKENKPKFPGDLWLVANVCEEGLGNLRGMRAVVDQFTDLSQGYIVIEGLGLGQVCHRGLGVTRFRISIDTPGGHSWVDYGSPSAIHELAGIITELSAISLPHKPRTTLNVGVIQGGTTINSIAGHAYFDIDLRCEDQTGLMRLANRVRRIAESREKTAVKVQVEHLGSRPAGSIRPSHPLVKLTLDCLADLNVATSLEIGSTDANIPLSEGKPAICIGLTRGGGSHTMKEYIELEPLSQGMTQLLMLVHKVWNLPSEKASTSVN